jgi:hypothetical protein
MEESLHHFLDFGSTLGGNVRNVDVVTGCLMFFVVLLSLSKQILFSYPD